MCELKLGAIQALLMAVVSFLPTSPDNVKIAYLTTQIDASAPWQTGGLILELFSSIYEFLVLLIAWKIIQFLLPLVISLFKIF
ncbi:MAG TPA: hypothetical protein VK211_23765 [Kamptonema sp.]|nr:hypothetical protein [Kamptonema sp.]